MAVQNMYNNYIKRQTQKPLNNFKEKVVNSLSGVSTQKTTSNANTSLPKQQINTTLSSANNVKPIVTTPAIANQQSRQIQPKTITQPTTQNTQQVAPTSLTQITPQPIQQVNPQVLAQNAEQLPQTNEQINPELLAQNNGELPTDVALDSVEGLIPTSAIQEAYSNLGTDESLSSKARTVTPEMMARTTTEQKTPQQMLEETLKAQEEQARKDYEAQQQLLAEQQKLAEEQNKVSIEEAEKAHKENLDTLYKNRYNQMEDLSVSGANRGIQYSPQQLGLENVVNINTNNNITKAGEERLNLLKQINLAYKQLLGQISSSSINALSQYQQSLLGYKTQYNNQIASWLYNDKKTEEDRTWQEQQDKFNKQWQEEQDRLNREWQEQQDKLNKEWQEQQNKVDRDWEQQQTVSDRDWQKEWLKYQLELEKQYETASSKTNSYSSGYSSSYTPYSYSRSYTPYSYSRSSYTPYSYSNSVDLNDEITQQTIDNTFKDLSTASYNAVNTGGVNNLFERADIYNEFIDPIYGEFYGQNKTVDSRLDNTRETALKHLFNRAYERDTNSDSKIGNTIYKNRRPLRQDYIDKVKNEQLSTKGKYFQKYSNDSATKSKARLDEKVGAIHESIMNSKNTKKNDTKVKATSTKTSNNKTTSKTTASKTTNTKTTSKATNTKTTSTKQAVKNSVSNLKKNTSTTKKTTKDVKVNTKAVSKSASNLKKTVTKIKDKIKKLFK